MLPSILLKVPYDKLLHDISVIAKQKGRVCKCAMIYAWPVRTEEIVLHEYVLRIHDDLQRSGVSTLLDIVSGDASTKFETATVDWIRECDISLLLGSSTFTARAKDSTTITHKELLALDSRKKKNRSSVIPVIMSGESRNALPPGYTEVMGADLRRPEKYFTEVASLAAKLLNIHLDAEVERLLLQFNQEAERVLQEAMKSVSQSALVQPTHGKYWTARVAVLKSKFTPLQLRLLDGRITERARQIDEYCKKVTKEPTSQLPLDTTPNAPSLEKRLDEFLSGSAEVLLLQAPKGAGKTWACQYLATKAWSIKQWIPIFIDLTKITSPTQHCVEKALKVHDLDDSTITQLQEDHTVLLLIEGFEQCLLQTNLYVRNQLQKWKGKAVFTCRSRYLENAVHPAYYFMPADLQGRPKLQGLVVICFSSVHSMAETDIEESSIPAITVPEAALSEAEVTSGLHKSQRARERWRKAITGVKPRRHLATYVPLYLYKERQRITQGFKLLQLDIIRPLYLDLLSEIRVLAGTNCQKAFISYAWPPPGPERTNLQGRLLQIVEDLEMAGVKGLLDILCLKVGMDINEFMREGIESSNAILWVGTPGLKARIKFKENGVPDNPATFEFTHIINKAKHDPSSLHSLWMAGDQASDAFPSVPDFVNFQPQDCRIEQEHYRLFPRLAAAILGVNHFPQFQERYNKYYEQTEQLEATFTNVAIEHRLEMAVEELKQQQARIETKLQELIDGIPSQMRAYLEGAKEAQLQTLQGKIAHMRTHSLSRSMLQVRSFYIPLKGGVKSDTPPSNYFDVDKYIGNFLRSDDVSRLMFIQGGPGAGKSLFGHHLERYLWNAGDYVPVVVALPQVKDPYHKLVDAALGEFNFTPEEVGLLKSNFRLVFILDGLDELPLQHVDPKSSLLDSNHLLGWPNAKVVLSCRSQYLPALEQTVKCPYQEYLTSKNKDLMTECFFMPFDDEQINAFLKAYAASPEAEWPSWELYYTQIDSISGLRSLSRTPFILKMIVSALPSMVAQKFQTRVSSLHQRKKLASNSQRVNVTQDPASELTSSTPIQQSDIYQAFTEKWFEREMWKQITHQEVPINEDLIANFREVAYKLGALLLQAGTTQGDVEALELSPYERRLIAGLPLQQLPGGHIKFVHKSLQDYFAAQVFLRILANGDATKLQYFLGTRPLTSETLFLDFVRSKYNPDYSASLKQQVVVSRDNRQVGTAASNAISFLCIAQCYLANLDLSGIYIPNANLDNAMLHNTNFQYADLTGASLRQAWLFGVDFTGATMAGVQFGRRSWEELESEVVGLATDGESLIAVEDSGTVSIHSSDATARLQVVLVSVSHSLVAVAVTTSHTRATGDCKTSLNQWYRLAPPGISTMLAVTVFEEDGCSEEVQSLEVFGCEVRFYTGKHFAAKSTSHSSIAAVVALDGRLLASSYKGLLNVDLTSGVVTVYPIINWSAVTCIAAAGESIIAGRYNGIDKWDLSSQVRTTVPVAGSTVTCVLALESCIFYGTDSGIVAKWSLEENAVVRSSSTPNSTAVTSLVLASNNVVLVNNTLIWDVEVVGLRSLNETQEVVGDKIISRVGDVSQVLDLVTQLPLVDLNGFAANVTSLATSDNIIIVGGSDGRISVWDTASGQQVGATMEGHVGAVNSIVVHRLKFFSGGRDRTLRTWDIPIHHSLLQPTSGHSSSVNCLLVTEDAIFSASSDFTVRKWDVDSGKPIGEPITTHKSAVACVVAVNRQIISASITTVKSWDPLSSVESDFISADFLKVFASYGNMLFAGSLNGNIRVWELSNLGPKELPLIDVGGKMTCLTTSEGSVIVGTVDGKVEIWNWSTGKSTQKMACHTGPVLCIATFNDLIISGGADNNLVVYHKTANLLDGQPMVGHTARVTSVSVCNGLVASGGEDSTVRVWDLTTRACLASVQWEVPVKTVVWASPHIVAAAGGKYVLRWKYDKYSNNLELVTCYPDGWALNLRGCIIENAQGLDDDQIKLTKQMQPTAKPVVPELYRSAVSSPQSAWGAVVRELANKNECH